MRRAKKKTKYIVEGRLTLRVDFFVTAATEDEAFKKIEELDWDDYTIQEAVDAEPRGRVTVNE